MTTHQRAAGGHGAERQGRPSSPPEPVRDAFGAFRSTPEPVPASIVRLLRRPGGGVDWQQAQRLRAPDGIAVWAVAGRRVVCLVSQSSTDGAATQTCTSATRAVADGVFFTSLAATGAAPATTRLVLGLVPDRARRVQIHTTGSPTRTATPTSNTFSLQDRAREPADRISLLP